MALLCARGMVKSYKRNKKPLWRIITYGNDYGGRFQKGRYG